MKVILSPIGKNMYGTCVLLILMFACAPVAPPVPPPDAARPANPPQLLDSFAVSTMRTGQTWQIFLEGSDPDGDMKDIWFVASQLGGNVWVNQFVNLKGEDRRHLIGYVALPTPLYWSSSGWETVRVEVRIRDSAGLYSQQVVYEVMIGSHTGEPIPPKWVQAGQHKLGTVFLDFERDREHHEPMLRR
jgi:hypothetical protein